MITKIEIYPILKIMKSNGNRCLCHGTMDMFIIINFIFIRILILVKEGETIL